MSTAARALKKLKNATRTAPAQAVLKTPEPRQIESLMKEKPSATPEIDSSKDNLFWTLMPLSEKSFLTTPANMLKADKPDYNPEPMPDLYSVLRELTEQYLSALGEGRFESLDIKIQIEGIQKRIRDADKILYLPYEPAPWPEPLPKKKEPRASGKIGHLRVYWALKNGKKASGQILFAGELHEEDARKGVDQHMNRQTQRTLIAVIRTFGFKLQFGYWPDGVSFRGEDYGSFFTEEYPGIFKVASCKAVDQYGGSSYLEVRLNET